MGGKLGNLSKNELGEFENVFSTLQQRYPEELHVLWKAGEQSFSISMNDIVGEMARRKIDSKQLSLLDSIPQRISQILLPDIESVEGRRVIIRALYDAIWNVPMNY